MKAVNVKRIFNETDSPALSPENGIRNEPSNLWISIKEIASILGRDAEEMIKITLENNLRLLRRIG